MLLERRAAGLLSAALACIVVIGLLALTPVYAAAGAGAIGLSAPVYSASVVDGVAVVVFTRTGGSSGIVQATFATADLGAVAGTDYASTSGTLTWNDGDVTPRSVMVPIAATSVGGEFAVALLSATGATFAPIIQTTVSIVPPPLPFGASALEFSQSGYSIIRGDSGLTVTVNRLQGNSGPVLATFAAIDGSAIAGVDYVATSGTLFWADGDSSPKSFVIPVSPQTPAGSTFSLAILSTAGATLGNIINTTVKFVATPMVNVSWVAPTTNVDGSELTDLAGYYVCIASAANPIGETIQMSNPAATSISIGNLSAGTYYVTTMAYNAEGTLSSPTTAVSTIVQ